MAKCPDCSGNATLSPQRGDGKCDDCKGSGGELNVFTAATEALSGLNQSCKTCGGNGVCQTCGGTGVIRGSPPGKEQDNAADEFWGLLHLNVMVLLLLSPFLIVAGAFVLPVYMLKWMISGRSGYGHPRQRSLFGKICVRIGLGYVGIFFLILSMSALTIFLQGLGQYFEVVSHSHFNKIDDWVELLLTSLASIACVLWWLAAGLMGIKLIVFGRFYAREKIARHSAN